MCDYLEYLYTPPSRIIPSLTSFSYIQWNEKLGMKAMMRACRAFFFCSCWWDIHHCVCTFLFVHSIHRIIRSLFMYVYWPPHATHWTKCGKHITKKKTKSRWNVQDEWRIKFLINSACIQ
jgi:hypothetical protein